ncbi:phasin family protein [Lysobacter sp. A3-1-A15]|uniref:phasin family protein n=1 Tax=Novilysobacter viscosus TaxID=3098602 RepID=UPI002EDA2F88
MATRNARKRPASARSGDDAARPGPQRTESQGEQLSRSLTESAQQIWLAGMGAFNRAQAEGSRLFEGLVRDGMGIEQQTRRVAGEQAKAALRTVESTVETARDKAVDGWDRLEKGFEERVHRTLERIGVPDRNDLAELSRRVDALTAELRRQAPAKPSKPRASAGSRASASGATRGKAKPVGTGARSTAKTASPAAKKPAARKVASKAPRPSSRSAKAPARPSAPRGTRR